MAATASTGERLPLPGGSSFVVVKSAAETGGERVELEITVPPGAPSPPPHFHPRQEEQWHVVAGSLSVLVGGDWRTLAEGESVTIPAGQVHTLKNRTTTPVRVLDVHVPALDFQDYMEELSRLTREGKITSLRDPRTLLHMASLWTSHRTTQVTASGVQRTAESVLAKIARLPGIRAG